MLQKRPSRLLPARALPLGGRMTNSTPQVSQIRRRRSAAAAARSLLAHVEPQAWLQHTVGALIVSNSVPHTTQRRRCLRLGRG